MTGVEALLKNYQRAVKEANHYPPGSPQHKDAVARRSRLAKELEREVSELEVFLTLTK